jgi:hypothetical protein
MKTSRTTPPSHLALRTVLAKIAFILTLAILSPDTYAGLNWDGGGGSGNWSEANNWNGNTLPSSNATLTFAGALQTITNNDYFAAGTTVDAFNFTNDGTIGKTGNFTLSGNSVTNTGADIVTTAIAVGGTNLRDTISLNIALNSNKIRFRHGAGLPLWRRTLAAILHRLLPKWPTRAAEFFDNRRSEAGGSGGGTTNLSWLGESYRSAPDRTNPVQTAISSTRSWMSKPIGAGRNSKSPSIRLAG